MATITGLSGGKYFINNPIWVDVDRTGDAVTDVVNLNLSIDSTNVFTAKYYTYNNRVSFDLAEIIKGLMPEPNHPTNMISGDEIQANSVTVLISLPNFNQTKIFYRGGVTNNRTNVIIPNNAILSESEKIPVWQGYPSAKYYLNDDGQIIFTDILTASETEKRKVVTCDPLFIRFLNTKGGYSFWLFEEWEINEKTKQGTIIERRGSDLDLGNKSEFTLSVSSRAEERYMPTMKALAQSSEIYLYRILTIMPEENPQFRQSILQGSPVLTWTPIYNAGNSIKWNAYDSVYEIDFKFDLRIKNNPSLI